MWFQVWVSDNNDILCESDWRGTLSSQSPGCFNLLHVSSARTLAKSISTLLELQCSEYHPTECFVQVIHRALRTILKHRDENHCALCTNGHLLISLHTFHLYGNEVMRSRVLFACLSCPARTMKG